MRTQDRELFDCGSISVWKIVGKEMLIGYMGWKIYRDKSICGKSGRCFV